MEPDRTVTLESVPVTVDGDERQLRQIIGNLLTNAGSTPPPARPSTSR